MSQEANSEQIYYMVLIYEFLNQKPLYLSKIVTGTTVEELEKIKCEKIKNEPLVTIINQITITNNIKDDENDRNALIFNGMFKKYRKMKQENKLYQAQDIFSNLYGQLNKYYADDDEDNDEEVPRFLESKLETKYIWVFYKDFIYKTGNDTNEIDETTYNKLIQECYFAYSMEQLKHKIMESISAISFNNYSISSVENSMGATTHDQTNNNINMDLLREHYIALAKFRFDNTRTDIKNSGDINIEKFLSTFNLILSIDLLSFKQDIFKEKYRKIIFDTCIKKENPDDIINCVLTSSISLIQELQKPAIQETKDNPQSKKLITGINADDYQTFAQTELSIESDKKNSITSQSIIQNYFQEKRKEKGSTLSLYGGLKSRTSEVMSQSDLEKNNGIIKKFLSSKNMRFLLLVSPDYVRKGDDGGIITTFYDFFDLIFHPNEIKDLICLLFVDYNFIDIEKYQDLGRFNNLDTAIEVYKKDFLINRVNEKTIFDDNNQQHYYSHFVKMATGSSTINNNYSKIIHVADLIAIYEYWLEKTNLTHYDVNQPELALQIVSQALTNYYTLLKGGHISKTFFHEPNEIWKRIADQEKIDGSEAVRASVTFAGRGAIIERPPTVGNIDFFEKFKDPQKNFNLKTEMEIMNTDRIMTILKLNEYNQIDDDGSTAIEINKSYQTTITQDTKFLGLGVKKNTDKKLNNIITTVKIDPVPMRFGGFTKIFKPKEHNTDEIMIMTEDDATGKIIQEKIMNKKNVFIFGYGASGSGKTTMLIHNTKTGKDGFVIMLCDKIVKGLGKDVRVQVSFKELYKKEIVSFLNDNNENKMLYGSAELKNLATRITSRITNSTERKIRFTRNNPQSSRSHLLCFLKFVEISSPTEGAGTNIVDSFGTLIVADLAGVENSFNPEDCETLIAMSTDKSKDDTYLASSTDHNVRIKVINNTQKMLNHINKLTSNNHFIKIQEGEMFYEQPQPVLSHTYTAIPETKKMAFFDYAGDREIKKNGTVCPKKLEGNNSTLHEIFGVTGFGSQENYPFEVNGTKYNYAKGGFGSTNKYYILQVWKEGEKTSTEYKKEIESWSKTNKLSLPELNRHTGNAVQMKKYVESVIQDKSQNDGAIFEIKKTNSENMMQTFLLAAAKTQLRKDEGKYINDDLTCLREDIFTSMIEKSHGMLFTAPNIEDDCLSSSFCSENSTCFMMKKSTKKYNSCERSLIIEELVNSVAPGTNESKKNDVLNSLNIVIFTVFNISKRGETDFYNEPIQYIDISPLKKYLHVKNDVNKVKKEIGFIFGLFDDPNSHNSIKNSPLLANTLFIRLMNDWKSDQNKFIQENMVSSLIKFIDNHNAATPIGTLIFTDNLAKFGIDRGVCVDQKIMAEATAAEATAAEEKAAQEKAAQVKAAQKAAQEKVAKQKAAAAVAEAATYKKTAKWKNPLSGR